MASRVFMVEDDPLVVLSVRPALEKDGFEFSHHSLCEGAVEIAKAFKPDVILLDVELPDGNGYSLCTQMRAEPSLAEVPVIFLTGMGDEQSRLKGFEAGSQDYVVKPFSVEELRARVRAHLAVKQRRDKLAVAVDELSLRERVRQDIADMIVHDLRSPISTVKITLDLLRQSGLVGGTEFDRMLGSAEGALDYMLLTVGDLLDLGAGKVKVEPLRLDLAALGRRLNGLLVPHAERRRVSFSLETAGEDGLRTDATLVFRIVANLAFNALKFSRPGGEVKVALTAHALGLRAEVADRGPGVPDSEKEKIFLKYHRAPGAEAGRFEGSGIGLAFCRLASRTLGGRVWVEDNPGGGSRFLLDVPPWKDAKGPADLVGPEALKAYAADCAMRLKRARELASKIPGPEAAAAGREIGAIAHEIFQSAAPRGFEPAGRRAMALDRLLASRVSGEFPFDDKLRLLVLSELDEIARLLPRPS